MTQHLPITLLPLPSPGKRLASMVLLWVAFGVLAGMLIIPPIGLIELISGTLAGTIVMCPLGAILGLLGGRAQPALVGGVAGGAIGAFTALLLSPSGLAQVACVGLIGGGIAGATSSAVFAWFRLLARLGPPAGRNR